MKNDVVYVLNAMMSLREFIRATTKEFHDANRARTAKWWAAEQKDATLDKTAAESSKAANIEEEEEEEMPLVRKKAKKSSRDSREEDSAQKRCQKEHVRKTVFEDEDRETTTLVIGAPKKQVEEEEASSWNWATGDAVSRPNRIHWFTSCGDKRREIVASPSRAII